MKRCEAIAWGALGLVLGMGLFSPPPAAASLTKIQAQLVVGGLDEPVFVTAPTNDPRLFVVERRGRIVIIKDGVRNNRAFLDLRSRVNSGHADRGMFSMAFDPDYASNGLFYVLYTNGIGDSVLSRFAVGANPDRADPSEEVLLVVDQPFIDKNGGTVAFGPDGFLYLSVGDGGSTGDPAERAQDPAELLGKMLRLDVGVPPALDSVVVAGGAYAIPASNPFVGVAGTREEIWSFGLQNPRRFSFDRATGDLWMADIGADTEEVDFEPAAHAGASNFGWDVEEGTLCNLADPAPAPPCGSAAFTSPVLEYSATDGNCAITGGFVHRGDAFAIRGHYLYGDYCTGSIWSFDPVSGIATDRTAELGVAGGTNFELMGFGEDGFGANYVVLRGLLLRSGSVHRILSAPPECGNGIDDDGDGQVDTADDGCLHAQWPEEDPECGNGIDDDGDGAVDTDDRGCAGRRWWVAESSGRRMACGLLGGETLLLPILLQALTRRRAKLRVRA